MRDIARDAEGNLYMTARVWGFGSCRRKRGSQGRPGPYPCPHPLLHLSKVARTRSEWIEKLLETLRCLA